MDKKEWVEATRRRLNDYSIVEWHLSKSLYHCGIKCERNYAIKLKSGRYVFIDFYFSKGNLAIELDGDEHKKWRDDLRSRDILEALPGVEIKRFKNKAVEKDVWSIVSWIATRLGVPYDPPLRTWVDEIEGGNRLARAYDFDA